MKRNEHNKSVGSKIERSDERINATSEVFTPMEVCIKIIQEIPEMMLKDSKSKFIDDSAGSGNFLLALQTELSKYHSLSHINDNMLRCARESEFLLIIHILSVRMPWNMIVVLESQLHLKTILEKWKIKNLMLCNQ